MKHYLLKAAMLTALVCSALKASAQRHVDRISHNPVKDEGNARGTLFNLPVEDTAYYFRADLPGDNFLVIQFDRLSYWQSGMIPEIFKLANQSWKQVQDSFIGSTTSRKLSIHIPPSNYPIIAAVSEHGKDEKTLLLKGQNVQPVRIAVDTINILKTLPSIDKDTAHKHQVQYTFLLKDLSEIEDLAANEALVSSIEHTFDSLVTHYRGRWRHQDAPFHSLQAQLDTRKEGKDRLQTTSPGIFLDNFEYTAELGTSFVAGAISPYAALRLSYRWQERHSRATKFVALSYSALGFVGEENNTLKLKSMAFLNAEFGAAFKEGNGPIPLSRTSVGFGYRVDKLNPEPYDFQYRVFFNYSLSRAVTLTPDFYIIPAKEDTKAVGFTGITLSLRLF